MSHNFSQQTKMIGRRSLFAIAFVLACAFCTTYTSAQSISSPPTPTLITPPEGNKAFLVGHAKGTQGYVCLPTSAGASTAAWTVSARPEATLFTSFFGHDVQIITHFLSPDEFPIKGVAPNPLPAGSATWQSSFDSSRVWAAVLHGNSIPASPDQPSCPNAGSIACLLLQSIGNAKGTTGNLLADTTFVQRLNTKGGLAPADGCFTSADVGKQALVPYTADYYFFRAAE